MNSPTPLRLAELRAHDAFVARLAKALVADPGAADDAAQEARFAFWRAAEKEAAGGEAIQDARGLLRRMVGRFASNRRRENARRAARERDVAKPEAGPTDHVVEREEARARLWAAVEALDEPLRQAVHLRWFDGRPPRDVAETLGVPVETVKTRLKRAQARLRESLEREYGGRDAWISAMLPLAQSGVGSTVGAGVALGGWIVAAKLKWIGIAVIAAMLIWQGVRLGAGSADAESATIGAAAAPAVGVAVDGAVAARESAAGVATSRSVESSPFMDRTSSAEFVLLGEGDRKPVRGAEAMLVRIDGSVDRGTTDDAGAVRFAAAVGAAQLVVRAPSRPPTVLAVDAVAGRTELLLPAGVTLRGRVTIDGATPTRSVPLGAFGLVAAGSRGVAAATAAAIGDLDRANMLEFETDADGLFTISGLDPTFAMPAYFTVRDATLEVEPKLQQASMVHANASFSTLAGEVVLPLLTAPRLRGRLRAHDGSAPPAGARLQVEFGFDASIRAHRMHFMGSVLPDLVLAPDGGVVVPFPRGPLGRGPVKASFFASVSPGSSPQEFTVDLDGAVDRDFGELTLAPMRRVTLRCVDVQGAAVAGAEVAALMTGGARWPAIGSVRSDAEGRAVLDVPADGETMVQVIASGFDRAFVRSTPDGRAEQDVVLRMGGRLVVRVVDATGKAAKGVRIGLSYVQPPLDGMSWSSFEGLERGRLQADISRERSADRPIEASGWTDDTGVFAVHGLHPGSTATVALPGGDRGATLTKTGAIEADRPLEIELRMIGDPHEFAVRLVRPDGGPGVGLVTFVPPGGGAALEAMAPDVDGAFRVRGVPWTAARLHVDAGDLFAPLDLALKPTDGGEPTVVLQKPSVRAECRIVDDSGQPVTGLYITADGRRLPLAEDAASPGVYVVDGVGAKQSVRISFTHAGRIIERTLQAGETPLRIVLPAVGGCEVVLGTAPAPDAEFLVTLRADPREMPFSASNIERPADGPPKATFGAIPAGRYRLEVQRIAGGRSTTFGAPQDVEILPRETKRLRIGP